MAPWWRLEWVLETKMPEPEQGTEDKDKEWESGHRAEREGETKDHQVTILW